MKRMRPSSPRNKRYKVKNLKPAKAARTRPSPVRKLKSSTMTIDEKVSKFSELVSALRGEPEFQRISLYVQNKTGMRLQVYLKGPASETDKHALLDELIQIIEAKNWALLPEAPNGQADSGQAPAPAPAPAKPAASATPAPAATDEDVTEDPPKADPAGTDDDDDPLLKALGKRLAAGKGLSEKQVRKIIKEEVPALVRAELRTVLRGVIDALK